MTNEAAVKKNTPKTRTGHKTSVWIPVVEQG
jgi:hypothetical protein